MSNIGSYDERIKDFSWKLAEEELGYKEGDVVTFWEHSAAGTVTFVGDTGVTLAGPLLKDDVSRGSHSMVSIFYVSNTLVVIYGDLRNT